MLMILVKMVLMIKIVLMVKSVFMWKMVLMATVRLSLTSWRTLTISMEADTRKRRKITKIWCK